MSKEYIDRNMSLKAIDEIFSKTDPESEEQIGVLKCRNAIREMQSSDVQHVVTCENCKYHFDDGAHRCMKLDFMTPASDFYCGFGKE